MFENNQPSVAVLLPCFNEEVTIGKVVRDFKAALPGAAVYVYDNNSTDGTGDIAREFFNTDELVRLLDEHKAGADRSRKIWIVYMFLMWYKIYFVDRTVPKKPEAR